MGCSPSSAPGRRGPWPRSPAGGMSGARARAACRVGRFGVSVFRALGSSACARRSIGVDGTETRSNTLTPLPSGASCPRSAWLQRPAVRGTNESPTSRSCHVLETSRASSKPSRMCCSSRFAVASSMRRTSCSAGAWRALLGYATPIPALCAVTAHPLDQPFEPLTSANKLSHRQKISLGNPAALAVRYGDRESEGRALDSSQHTAQQPRSGQFQPCG